MRTVEDNAEEFRELDHGDGWAFCRLVACSVAPDNGHGVNERYKDGTIVPSFGKVSAGMFAKKAGTNRQRVMRFWAAWGAAAAMGWCPPAADLVPDDASTVPLPDVPWKDRENNNVKAGGLFDSGNSGGRPRAPLTEIAERADKDPAYAKRLVKELAASPTVQQELAKEAVHNEHLRAEVAKEAIREQQRKDKAREAREDTPERKRAKPLRDMGIGLRLIGMRESLLKIATEIRERPLTDDGVAEVLDQAGTIRAALDLVVLSATGGNTDAAMDAALNKILAGES